MATSQQRPAARPYRDFLTPALHRRFTNAALMALGLCYVESVLIGLLGEWDVVWSWFPLGWIGMRTLLLFVSVMAVFILRVAQMHIGARQNPSPFHTFSSYALRLESVQTLLWYMFSAWFFSEVCIWSATNEANLAMVDPGKPYERPRLNERPIYLRTMFQFVAIGQALLHLYKDYDHVPFPTALSDSTTSTDVEAFSSLLQPLWTWPKALVTDLLRFIDGRSTASSKPSLTSINAVLLPLLWGCVVVVGGTIVYGTFLRRTAWHWTFAVAKVLFSLPKAAKPDRYPPYLPGLMARFVYEGTLLVFLWRFANTAFTFYLSQEPLKKGMPLTSDSKDPNGSLLAGLKAKKEIPRNTAFWELRLIAECFQPRRETVFKELDRPGGSTWAQTLSICLGELNGMNARLTDFHKSPSDERPAPTLPHQAPRNIPGIPSVIKQDNIIAPRPKPNGHIQSIERNVGDFAKSHGQYANSQNPLTSPTAKRLLGASKDALISPQRQRELSASAAAKQASAWWLQFLQTPPGTPFRATFARRAARVLLGGGTVNVIVNAAVALARLAACSLKEDMYGKVQKDVANIIRTYTSTVGTVENFVKSLSIDASDVDFDEGRGDRWRVGEVQAVLAALKEGLKGLMGEFGEFREDLGLSIGEARMAREACGLDRGAGGERVKRRENIVAKEMEEVDGHRRR